MTDSNVLPGEDETGIVGAASSAYVPRPANWCATVPTLSPADIEALSAPASSLYARACQLQSFAEAHQWNLAQCFVHTDEGSTDEWNPQAAYPCTDKCGGNSITGHKDDCSILALLKSLPYPEQA